MTQTEIEERLIALEAEFRLLKERQTLNKADPKWVLAHTGRFANDPGFEDVVRLGREYRESLDAKPKKKPTKNRKPKSSVKNGRA
jgi:hypothetical protein